MNDVPGKHATDLGLTGYSKPIWHEILIILCVFYFFDHLCAAVHLSGSNAALLPETNAAIFYTLQVIASVDYPSKFGRATGRVSFTVSGGSGQWADQSYRACRPAPEWVL